MLCSLGDKIKKPLLNFLQVFHWPRYIIFRIIQTVANVLTGWNSAQCHVGRVNYNESKTIRKASCFVVTRSFTLYSDHQTTECSTQTSSLLYVSKPIYHAILLWGNLNDTVRQWFGMVMAIFFICLAVLQHHDNLTSTVIFVKICYLIPICSTLELPNSGSGTKNHVYTVTAVAA